MSAKHLLIGLAITIAACSSKKEPEKIAVSPAAEFYSTGDAAKGKILYTTCIACHGDNAQGNNQLKAPALVNNEPWYLYRQLMNFKKGIRGYATKDTLGMQMAPMAKSLTDSMAVADVVAYIKTLPAFEIKTELKGDAKKGERTYQSVCGSCHGPAGKGNKLMNAPRLNGLQDWYLQSQILKFKNSIRGDHPQDLLGAQMIPMASMLQDQQAIDDVITYILSVTIEDSKIQE